MPFDLQALRAHFPIFNAHPQLVYLDNAATTHKPDQVINRLNAYYQLENANIKRGLYPLAHQASQKYEGVRQQLASFLGSASPAEIVFTAGTTAGINLVAQGWLAPQLNSGDEVIISAMEHHANLIPWQQVCKLAEAQLRIIPLTETGTLDLVAFEKLLTDRTKLVATVHICNSTGCINPIDQITSIAHAHGVPILVDGAQSTAHYQIDVQALGVDFWVFSGHKLYGPTGIGVLYGRKELLEQIQPQNWGGGMIERVTYEDTYLASLPRRLEAGTPHIAGVLALGEALSFLEALNQQQVRAHIERLTQICLQELQRMPKLRLLGPFPQQAGIISFNLEDIHPHDVASALAQEGIAVRAGHHCTEPLLKQLGEGATLRMSFAPYNTEAEVQHVLRTLSKIDAFFR